MELAVEAGKNEMIFARLGILIGLISVVTTIIYFTPIPDENKVENCLRPCHELDWPMICRFQIRITQDAFNSNVLTNLKKPAPDIQVCKNDILVIDVINRTPDKSLAIHWRGQDVKETPQMDGAPMVTQCPIVPYTTFQYKLRASVAGTHVYHTSDYSAFGAFIVRQSEAHDSHAALYDFDENIISIYGENGEYFINGENENQVFKLKSNSNYRFRLIFINVDFCSVEFSIEQHNLKIIALDGQDIVPEAKESLELFAGERADFILSTDQSAGNYKISVVPLKGCKHFLPAFAVLTYKNSNKTVPAKRHRKSQVVLEQPSFLKSSYTDHVFYIYFGVKLLKDEDNIVKKVGFINNRTMLLPSSPVISQFYEISPSTFCPENLDFCNNFYNNTNLCECTHIIQIPLGESVEFIFSNGGDLNEWQGFHIHGYYFYEHKEPDKYLMKDTITIPPHEIVTARFIADNPGFWLLEGSHFGMQLIMQVGKFSDIPSTPDYFPKCGNWIGPKYFLT